MTKKGIDTAIRLRSVVEDSIKFDEYVEKTMLKPVGYNYNRLILAREDLDKKKYRLIEDLDELISEGTIDEKDSGDGGVPPITISFANVRFARNDFVLDRDIKVGNEVFRRGKRFFTPEEVFLFQAENIFPEGFRLPMVKEMKEVFRDALYFEASEEKPKKNSLNFSNQGIKVKLETLGFVKKDFVPASLMEKYNRAPEEFHDFDEKNGNYTGYWLDDTFRIFSPKEEIYPYLYFDNKDETGINRTSCSFGFRIRLVYDEK